MFWYGVFLDPYRTRCSGSKMGPACVRQRRSIAVALGAVRFMLAPCSPACNPYGPAGGTVRSVIRKLKNMRADACIKLVAPVGTDLTAISDRKRNAFKSQVRVRVQLGTFPEVVTIKLADDTAIKVGADLAVRDHLTVELTTTALAAIKKMVKALQRSPLTPFLFCLRDSQGAIDEGAAAEEGSDDGDAAEGDSDDGGEGDTADTSSSAASPPEKTKGIWWLQRGECYQAKRKISYENGEPCYEWKRFKPESESIEHLCAAHEDARQWAADGI